MPDAQPSPAPPEPESHTGRLGAPAATSFAALFDQALRLRLRQPAELLALGQQLQTLASGDPLQSAQALTTLAWHQVSMAGAVAAQPSVDVALKALEAVGEAGRSWAQDLRSLQAHWQGRYEEGIEHAQAALAAQPHPMLQAVVMARLGSALANLGRLDEALPWYYRARASATQAGDSGTLAAIVSIAGGLQVSLGNLDDGAALAEQAWRLVCDGEPDQIWAVSAINWIVSLAHQQRLADWQAVADAFVQASPAFNPQLRWRGRLAIAGVQADARQDVQAQDSLDTVAAQWPSGQPESVDAVWVQALLHNRAGRAAAALQLCQQRLAPDSAALKTDPPLSQARLYAEAVAAARALGDVHQALHWQIELAALQKRIHQDAARSRRITLQIHFELQAAQQARDLAQQGEQQAQREGQRLAELNQRLEEANLAKTRFLAVASHDLRQPLHALGLQLAHLRSGVEGVARLAVEHRMEQAMGSLRQMFDTLLDLSRMDAGVVAPRRQVVALAPLLVRLVDELTPLAQSRGLRLGLHLVGERFSDTDPALLETMLRNLLGNALKYTPSGGALLALRHRQQGLTVEVWDSGVGIASSEHEKVFEEFYQVNQQATDSGQGLGLGLAIVRRLGVLLGHRLQLDSVPGRGSRFRLHLAAVDALAAPEEGAGPCAADTVSAQASGRLRIGVIDDDPIVRESLAALLQRWGHEVSAAACANEWLKAPSLALDAIIADYRLAHGATGVEEVSRLRQHAGWPVPALLVSGDTSPAGLRALQSCGLPSLPKPLQALSLRAWLLRCASQASGTQPGAAAAGQAHRGQ